MNSVPYLNRGPQSHETESPPERGEPAAAARPEAAAGVRKTCPPPAAWRAEGNDR